MAIFGKDGAQQGSRAGTTVVAAGSKFVGNVALSDDLHLDGRIEGDIESDAGVVIGEQGCLVGSIRAGNVIVSGRVEGSIAAKRLEIVSGGAVEGDVHTIDLVIEPGGRFNGSSEILSDNAISAERGESGRPSSDATSGGDRREPKKRRSPAAGGGEEATSIS